MKLFNLPFFPDQASSYAGLVDLIFLSFTGVCALVFLGVVVFIIFFSAKYRRGRKADRSSPPRINIKLELAWTILPMGIFFFFFAWAAWAYYKMGDPPADSMLVYVIPKQWMWKFEYPDGKRLVNELYVPVNKPVKLMMSSEDAIHSFYVPNFRLKQDILPFRYTTAWFKATRPGVYPILCAEYCGTGHSLMRGRVVALSAADYSRWQEHSTLEGAELQRKDLASQGRELFTQLGCRQCHFSPDGKQGPELEGLYGREVALNNRRRVVADESYIRESILEPGAKLVQGYGEIMPSFKGQVSEEQIAALIEYIKRLHEGEAAFQQESEQ